MKLKFLSLNVWHGFLIERCADFLAEQDADIVILQEVENASGRGLPARLRSLEVIQQKANYPYVDFVPALMFNHADGKAPEGNAILSKFKILNSGYLFFQETFNDDYHDSLEMAPKYPRVLQHAELDTPAGIVNVFNIHGVWDLDGDKYSVRRQEMERKVLKSIEGKANVLLGGDTNAKPANQAIININKQLTSVFADSLKSTFNMRRKDNPGYATAAVDMLFVSPGIKILDKGCPDIDVSDHLPVWAELEIS